jgi:hypothetical protein
LEILKVAKYLDLAGFTPYLRRATAREQLQRGMKQAAVTRSTNRSRDVVMDKSQQMSSGRQDAQGTKKPQGQQQQAGSTSAPQAGGTSSSSGQMGGTTQFTDWASI